MTAKWQILALALALGGCAQIEPEVKYEELPAVVQQTVEANRGGGAPRRIMQRVVSGRTVYDVEIDRARAANRWLRIATDGTLLSGGPK